MKNIIAIVNLFIGLTISFLIISCQKQVDYMPEISALKNSRDSLATALAQTNANLANVSTNVVSINKSLDSIRYQLSLIGTQINNLNTQLLAVNANILDINNQLTILNAKYADLLARLNTLLAQLNNIAPFSLPSGLIAYYPFNGNAIDSSGNGLNGSVFGATLANDRFGNPNSAYSFNGTTNYIVVANNSKLNAYPISVSCWFKFDATKQLAKAGAIVNKYYAASWVGWSIEADSTNGGSINPWYLRNYTNTVIGDYGHPSFKSTNLGDDKWHNAIFTLDIAAGGKLFIDGYLTSSRPWDGTAGQAINSWPMYFGYYPSGNVSPDIYYYLGLIDDVRIYNRVLNQSEISYLASH